MTQLQSLPKLNKGSNFGMTKTVADVLKSRKFAKINGYCSYEFVVNSVRTLYSQIGHLQMPYDLVLNIEKSALRIENMYNQKSMYEALDWMLLEAVNAELAYPVLCVSKELSSALFNTAPPRIINQCITEKAGNILQIPLAKPFLRQAVILLPKEVNGVEPKVSGFVFKIKNNKSVFVSILGRKLGLRGISTILLQETTPSDVVNVYVEGNALDVEENSIHFLANLFMYQASIKSKPEDYLEPVYAKSRGFGGGNHKGILSPRMIGEGYKPKVIRNYETTGTHASPRTHWRSGHWRQHMIGSRKNPEHKTIWIEPTLING